MFGCDNAYLPFSFCNFVHRGILVLLLQPLVLIPSNGEVLLGYWWGQQLLHRLWYIYALFCSCAWSMGKAEKTLLVFCTVKCPASVGHLLPMSDSSGHKHGVEVYTMRKLSLGGLISLYDEQVMLHAKKESCWSLGVVISTCISACTQPLPCNQVTKSTLEEHPTLNMKTIKHSTAFQITSMEYLISCHRVSTVQETVEAGY